MLTDVNKGQGVKPRDRKKNTDTIGAVYAIQSATYLRLVVMLNHAKIMFVCVGDWYVGVEHYCAKFCEISTIYLLVFFVALYQLVWLPVCGGSSL